MGNALACPVLGLYFAAMPGTGEHNASRLATLLVGVVVLVISSIVSAVVLWARATGTGPLASMLVGLVVVGLTGWQGLLANSQTYGGLLASPATFVVVSLLTPRASPETVSAWDRRISGEGDGGRHA